MAGKLSFSIAINLLTENFKRGTNNVKNGLRAMQLQVLTFAAALGAGGLGLSNFVTRLIDVARETSRTTTALKNVSGTMSQYADNQRYLLDLAKKYGLEINALTGNYAKFTAAASISGMTMADQRKIFESTSRACTAFGMSADDSNSVFLALSQMMSKGKISSEELRLQMGERLPIALQAMAKAAGVSVGGLDKLMKQGKLMSADILPKFADALNEMIPNVDTDNLETSVNRLKNAFTEFAKGTNIQDTYKSLIDWLTGAVNGLQGKISSAITFVIAMISGKLLASVVSYFSQFWKLIDTTIGKSKTAEAQKLLFTQKRIEAEKVYESTLTNYNTTENGKRLASKSQLNKAEKAMDSARVVEKKAMLTAETAAEKAAAVSSLSVWGKTINTLKLAFTQFGRTLKAVFASAWPLILITAISAVIAKFKEMYDEAKRIKSIFSDYKKEAESVGNTAEISTLNAQLQIMNDKKQSQENINSAQAQLQKMLGVEHKSQKELNELVAKRVELLKETARADFHARKQVEFEDKNKTLASGVGLSSSQAERLAPLAAGKDTDKRNSDYYYQLMGQMYRDNGVTGRYDASAADEAMKEYAQNMRVIADSSAELKKSTVAANKLLDIKPLNDPDDPDKKKTPLQKEQESYNKQYEELRAKLEISAITQAEYNKALGDLNIKMFAEAKGTGDKEVLESEYYKLRKEAAEKAVRDQDKNTAMVDFEKVQKEYNDKVRENQALQSKGLISQKKLNENIASLSLEAANSAAGIKGIGEEADVFIAAMKINALTLAVPVKKKQRDTFYDYKKTKVDIAGEELDNAKEYAKQLQDDALKKGQELSDELANMMAGVPSLEKVLKIATVIEDVKNLKKELSEGVYSGVKEIASSADRLVSSFKNLGEVFDPESEADGWERLMAVWSAMTTVVDSFLSIAKMIENVTELTNKLTKAKVAEEAVTKGVAAAKSVEATVDTSTTLAKVANDSTETASAVTATGTKAAATIAASGVEAVAYHTAMVAGATAAFAAIPVAGPILAAGQIAAMEALMLAAAIPFATGGIITGGPSSGDKILARVNAGEMILNGGQQANLFEAINSGRLGSTGNSSTVTTKIRSKDLILIINNELKSQGKKPIS